MTKITTLSAALLLATQVGFSQSIKLTVSPEKSWLVVNGRDAGTSTKISVKDDDKIVMATLEGYVTQGLKGADIISAKKPEYAFKLAKQTKLPSTFKGQKIKFTRFVDQTGGKFVSIGYGYTYSTINFEDNSMTTPFPKLMSDWGYKMVGLNALFEEKGDAPDFVLAGEIIWAEKNTAGSGFQSSVAVKWSLYSTELQKVVYNETTYGYSDLGQKKYSEEVEKSLEDATIALMSDTKFQTLVTTSSDAASAKSGVALSLPKPTAKKYGSYGDMIKGSTGSVVTVKTNLGHGSGFIISEGGYVLTNQHVIAGAETIDIVFESGFSFGATLVKSNKERDVALLKMSGKGFKPLTVNQESDAASIGNEVIAIGTPMNIELGQTVTKGIVSGKREIEGQKYIQTDVNINPGNSGGPLINSKGEVIGIIVSKVMQKNASGLGFALPINEALDKLEIEFK